MLDTALALQLKRAGLLLERDLVALGEVLKRRALEFRDTVEVGRTHGIHAEPITFGMKLGIWAFEVSRHLKRLRIVTVNVAVGKISGAVGAYNNIDPRVEDLVCEELGLAASRSQPGRAARPPRRVPQPHRPRRREHRDVRDRVPPPAAHRGARSRGAVHQGPERHQRHAAQAQPHHLRTPHRLRPRAARQRHRRLENVALWHERDISHSSVERIIFPDLHAARLHAAEVHQAHRHARRGRGAHAGEPRPELPPRLQRGGAAGARRQGHAARRRLPRRAGRAMRAWRDGVDFGELIKATTRPRP